MKTYKAKTSKTKNLHFSMFAPNAQVAKDNASHAFGKQLGSVIGNSLNVDFTTYSPMEDVDHNVSPGVLSFETSLVIGDTSAGFNAPINKALRALYAKYWKKNSSTSNFQEMDVGIYTWSSAQIVAIHSWLKAIYAACYLADTTNKYTRSGVLIALGVSPSDITKHVTDLRGFINQLTIDLANYNLDASIPLYEYAANMYTTFLKDEANFSKTQYYVCRPRHLMKYVGVGPEVGSIEYINTWVGESDLHLLTYSELTTVVNEVVSAFTSSYYIASISAAIGKAEVPTFVLDTISEDYRIDFVYDVIALTRLQNSNCYNPVIGKITQDPIERTLSQTITISSTGSFGSFATLLGAMEPQVVHAISPETATPENVIVLTSLTTGCEQLSSFDSPLTEYTARMLHYGFEIVSNMKVVSCFKDGTLGVTYLNSALGIGSYWNADTYLEIQKVFRAAWLAKEFDFFPNLRMYAFEPEQGKWCRINVIDTDYSDIFTNHDLAKVHQASIQTILGVPDKL